jgi:phage protein D
MANQQAIPIYQSKQGEQTFYAPAFEIRIDDRRLPATVVRDVMQVTYKDSIEKIDSFELKINNWDADRGCFKYVGLSSWQGASGQSAQYAKMFDPGQKLEIYIGYQDDLPLCLMMVGQITTLEPDFPGSGMPTLSVRGLNILHSFRKKQHTWAWEKERDSDIAEKIGKQPVSDKKPGLGIEVRVDKKAAGQENEETFVFMNNQYDIVFLMERARRHGYSLYMHEEKKNGKAERYLYFGPSDLIRDVTYELVWGQSLIQFRPTLTTANQVSQVTVRGWNRRTRKPIVGTAKWGDPGLDINRDQHAVALAIKGKHEVIIDRPVHSVKEAKALAKDILRNLLKDMVKASGSTVGLPDLRAGRKVHIRELGERFSGEYFITETTHTIGDGGYQTTFNARREKALKEKSQ